MTNLTVIQRAFVQTESNSIDALAFNHRGDQIAYSNGTLSIWDLTTNETRMIASPEPYVCSLVFTADDSAIIGGCTDGNIRSWEVATGDSFQIGPHHSATVVAVDLNPRGDILATGSRDESTRLWNLTDGREIMQSNDFVHPDNDYNFPIAFSPDGKYFAAGGKQSLIKFWDAETGAEVHSISTSITDISVIAFSRDGSLIAVGGWDNQWLEIYEVTSGTQKKAINNRYGTLCSLAFSPDGNLLLCGYGNEDVAVRLWDWAAKQEIAFDHIHSDWAYVVKLSPDGKWIACGGGGKPGGTIELWEIRAVEP